LAIDPRPPGSTKLAGTDFWRLRVGDLRVIYVLEDDGQLIVVLRVARRSESTYRHMDRA
jgi:mRNA interferase RelE/StbE